MATYCIRYIAYIHVCVYPLHSPIEIFVKNLIRIMINNIGELLPLRYDVHTHTTHTHTRQRSLVYLHWHELHAIIYTCNTYMCAPETGHKS